jgi:outer membrane protein TolC
MSRILWITAVLLCLPLRAHAEALPLETVLGSERSLSLQEAIDLALEHNLALRVARAEPAIAGERVGETRGAFDPRLVGSSSFEQTQTPIASPVQAAFGGSRVIEEDIWNHGGGLTGATPLGLSYSSLYNIRRTDSSSGFTALEPEWRAQWETAVTLPLLKGLVHNEPRLAVQRSRLAKAISDEQFRAVLNEIVQGVENAYWELTAARSNERVAVKSLETARNLLEQTQVQYQVGVVSKVAVTQAEAGVAERELNLIIARNRAQSAQDRLLNLIAAPDISAFAVTRIEIQEPTFIEYNVLPEAALAKAVANRPELSAARTSVEDAELQLDHAWNQRLPQLDLRASYRTEGLSGDSKIDSTTGLPLVTGFETGHRHAHDDWFSDDGSRSWSLMANFELPLGNETARSRYTQRKIELRRARTSLRRTEQDLVLEVRDAIRQLQSSIDAVRAAERRKAAQAETLRAEQERLRLGDSTPFQVLEFESDFAEAEQQLIEALRSYRDAITALESAQSTLLESRGISVEREIERE